MPKGRPRIFTETASINVYLHPEQKQKLTAAARAQGKSPSALVREFVESIGVPTCL